MNKCINTYTQNGILFSNEKRKFCYLQQNKDLEDIVLSDISWTEKKQILYDIPYTFPHSFSKTIKTKIIKAKMVLTRGWVRGERERCRLRVCFVKQ